MSISGKSDLRAWRKLYNLAKKVDGAAVHVGPTDGENAEIGLIHEYGAPEAGIPARPFMAQTFRNRRAELIAIQAKIAQGILTGVLTEERAMNLLGAWAVGAIKATITRDGQFAPLKPATIARRKANPEGEKSDKPLIDTGQLVGSITFVVVD